MKGNSQTSCPGSRGAGPGDYCSRGKTRNNDKSLSSKQCRVTYLPGCVLRQSVNLLKWKVVLAKRKNQTKENLTYLKEEFLDNQT